MAGKTYVVVKGDTLSEICERFKADIGNGATLNLNERMAYVAELNHISDWDLIYVGQVLKLNGSADPKKVNTTYRATIDRFGLQSNTDRTVFATWTWDKEGTKEYHVIWSYTTPGSGTWFEGSDTKVTKKQSVYNAPSNASRVSFRVKPLPENSTSSAWVAEWSSAKTYSFSSNPPPAPSAPTITTEYFLMTMSLENLPDSAAKVQFDVLRYDSAKGQFVHAAYVEAKTSAGRASGSYMMQPGKEYKARARGIHSSGEKGEWSNYTENISTIPATPEAITTCRANSETSVYLEWSAATAAKTYDIQYATKKQYFEGSDQVTTVSGIEFTKYEKTGLTSGERYFFRVRAVNEKGESSWSDIVDVVVGKKPAAPTTWSSTTTAIVGEPLTLYWMHNSEDGSSETFAELELDIDGIKYTYNIPNDTTDEENKDKTKLYPIDTSKYTEGTKLLWRVRTAGITNIYGDWSVQRTVDIYAPPSVELNITNVNDETIETLDSFPFYISALAGPSTQAPIGYHVSIISNDVYETVDNLGNVSIINVGQEVYSKYFDTNMALMLEMTASRVDLENNISYTITVVASMNSGLTAEASTELTVAWTDNEYAPNAEISIDKEALVAYLRPHCEDEHGNLIEDVLLSVYRREFDGEFVELATGLENVEGTFITDPHPALDYARYRIVATTKSTGTISYYDMPGYPVGEKAVVIQWDEQWSSFDGLNVDSPEEPAWSGSLLRLPYNIDISDKYKPDVALVQYVGHSHPTGYYGTHRNETSTWNVEIPKTDVETLYSIRRLATWMDNVYVREPGGSGYWASITVSFSRQHCETTIPVTFEVTRVEGGA